MECAVCARPIESYRLHYGGVCCQSCRTFFRRVVITGMFRVCMTDKTCYDTPNPGTTQCIPCRYEKCLKVGMDKKLVKFQNGKPINSNGSTQRTTEEQNNEPTSQQNGLKPVNISKLQHENISSEDMDEDILVIAVDNDPPRNPPTNIIFNIDPVANQNSSFNVSNHNSAFGNSEVNEKTGFISFNPQGSRVMCELEPMTLQSMVSGRPSPLNLPSMISGRPNAIVGRPSVIKINPTVQH